MCEVIAKLSDKEVTMYSKFNIGDYVKVVDAGHQYSSYIAAFKFFWGDTERYYIPYNYEEKNAELPTCWKVINMAIHPTDKDVIMYHIRSIDGKNCVIGEKGIKPLNFHHRNREPIGKIMVYQLPFNGDVMKHKWTEKLYKIIK
jgi:hypothetical protein